jgi:hypothetical protein
VRPRGVLAIIFSTNSLPEVSPAEITASVRMSPGLTAFTRIFLGPSSFARTSVIESTAPLVAEDVRFKLATNFGFVKFRYRSEPIDSRVVHKDVEMPEGFLRLRKQPSNVCIAISPSLDSKSSAPALMISVTTDSAAA